VAARAVGSGVHAAGSVAIAIAVIGRIELRVIGVFLGKVSSKDRGIAIPSY
jgi:hypothetical protein